MKINCLINTGNKENQIIKILLKKNFNYLETKEFLVKDSNIIIVIDITTSLEQFENFLKFFKSKKNKIIFFLPKKFENFDFSKTQKLIFYPIHILDFEKNLKSFFNQDRLIYKNVELNYNGFLLNITNNKKIYLTDTETAIVKILFTNKVVEKDKIKKNILNINSQIDTKSLESHVSRIRKKLLIIDESITINSFDSNKIKIN